MPPSYECPAGGALVIRLRGVRAMVLFGCGSMVLAALVLLSTGRDKMRAAAIQFFPPAIAVVLAVLS